MKCFDTGSFVEAWGGIASLEVSLSAVWTGARHRGISIDRIVRWMAAAPARLAGIDRLKGAIAVGRDADLVLWDPDAQFTVDPKALRHLQPATPYAGMTLRGRVHMTMLRGDVIYRDGKFVSETSGRMITSAA